MIRYLLLAFVLLFTLVTGYAMARGGRVIDAGTVCGMAALTFYFFLEDINIDKAQRQQDLVRKASDRDYDSY